MTRALMSIGRSDVTAEVDVYRDGNVVTIVCKGGVTRETPYGNVRTQGLLTQQYETVEAFEHDRDRLRTSKRFALGYNKLKEYIGVDDDARNAPPLPDKLRHLLPDHMRALHSRESREPNGRPYLALNALNDRNRGSR